MNTPLLHWYFLADAYHMIERGRGGSSNAFSVCSGGPALLHEMCVVQEWQTPGYSAETSEYRINMSPSSESVVRSPTTRQAGSVVQCLMLRRRGFPRGVCSPYSHVLMLHKVAYHHSPGVEENAPAVDVELPVAPASAPYFGPVDSFFSAVERQGYAPG